MIELRRIASEATPGPWTDLIDRYGDDDNGPGSMFVTNDPRGEQRPIAEGLDIPDARHIATFDPRRALALLDVAEAAKVSNGHHYATRRLDRHDEPMDEECGECGNDWPCPGSVTAAALARLEALA